MMVTVVARNGGYVMAVQRKNGFSLEMKEDGFSPEKGSPEKILLQYLVSATTTTFLYFVNDERLKVIKMTKKERKRSR